MESLSRVKATWAHANDLDIDSIVYRSEDIFNVLNLLKDKQDLLNQTKNDLENVQSSLLSKQLDEAVTLLNWTLLILKES